VPSAAVVIQFADNFIAPLVQYPECDRIRQLLTRASQGLSFPAAAGVQKAIRELPGSRSVARITSLLELLHALSETGIGERPLASPYFQPAAGKKSEGRIGKVFQYLHLHSSETLPLHEIAAQINLSESAFCKFFKRTTGKTFSDYLSEIRIGHACHLLSESDETIAEIAYRSGFDSLTYFNRMFLRKKGVRPGE